MVSTLVKTRVLIADDHPLVRYALRSILTAEPDLTVVGEADNGEAVVKLTDEIFPEVIIMDISMPVMSGLEATRLVKARHPTVGILALTVHDDDELILSLLQAGADGYLIKNVLNNEVVQAVRSLRAGEYVLSPVVFQRVLKYAVRNAIKPITLNTGVKLTGRELDLLKLLAKGLTNKDIACEAGLSLRGVKAHLVNIFAKLNAKSRTEALLVSLRMGILTLDDIQ